jgi:cytoskeletal protein RodZ
MKAGEIFSITSSSNSTSFDGSWTVKAVTNTTTFTADITATNQAATAYPGYVQMQGDDDTKWIYATGKVFAHLGKSEVVNDSLAQGYDVSGNRNDMKIKATRSAIAYFDPSVHLAIKLDLTV